MSDLQAFNDHVNKLMFIKRLQEREGLLDKYMSGNGLLPSGGGMSRGLGLPSGGGLDSSGFKNRRPAVQEQMLSGAKAQLDEARELRDELNPDNFARVKAKELRGKVPEEKIPEGFDPEDIIEVPLKNLVRLQGRTKKAIFRKKELDEMYRGTMKTIDDIDKDPKIHDINSKNFTGTTSKAIIFKHDDGKTSKFKSIADLSKQTGFSKYKILGSFKPKKTGDSFYHKKLKGTLTFVDKKQYKTHSAISSFTPPDDD